MATFSYYQYGELTGTTLTRVEVIHRVCGAETFTPCDPDIIEAALHTLVALPGAGRKFVL